MVKVNLPLLYEFFSVTSVSSLPLSHKSFRVTLRFLLRNALKCRAAGTLPFLLIFYRQDSAPLELHQNQYNP